MKVPSYQQIRRISNRAMRGDAVAESKLRSELTRLGKQANKKLKALEREGLEASPAYKLAIEDLKYVRRMRQGRSRVRYPESNLSLDINEVTNALWSVANFLGRKTSTVKGFKSYLEGRRKVFENMGIDIKGREELFDEFMSTDWFNEFVKFDSTAAFTTMDEMIDNGVSVDKVKQLFKDYVEGNIDFIAATYEWEFYIDKDNPFV